MNYNKDNGLLNMIRRTDPMIMGILDNGDRVVTCYIYPQGTEEKSILKYSFKHTYFIRSS
jgi:hypothetical protein